MSSGISLEQPGAHVAQKFTTTSSPFRAEDSIGVPEKSLSENSGAGEEGILRTGLGGGSEQELKVRVRVRAKRPKGMKRNTLPNWRVVQKKTA